MRPGHRDIKQHQSSNMDRRRFLGLCGAAALAPSLEPLFLEPTPKAPTGRVVMVRNEQATSFQYGDGQFYGDYVNQAVVDRMLDEGLMTLTGAATVKEVWRALIPRFKPGHRIAVKVNFNNCKDWEPDDFEFCNPIEPVNAIVRGLKLLGAKEGDVWVYDAVRTLPRRFVERCRYPGVRFWVREGDHGKSLAYLDKRSLVSFNYPDIPKLRIYNIVTEADWLINIPILKRHTHAGVTLAFKNHFGSIQSCGALHPWTFPLSDNDFWVEEYNPMVDIALNPHFHEKTVLIVGDGLFGNYDRHHGEPIPWRTFGNGSPNSLFLSRDVVAADSVMHDVLRLEEPDFLPSCDSYLRLADAAGLGVFEHGDPRHNGGYKKIDFLRFDQTGDAAISGLVLSGGAPVARAKISAVHKDGGAERKTRTDSSGYYSFGKMRIGKYRLTARKRGLRSRNRNVSYRGKARNVNLNLRSKG